MDYGPKETLLTGHELTVTDEMKAEAFWLLRKYTSFTYLGRMYQLYAEFLRGYEDVARRQSDRNSWYRQNLADLYKYQASFDKGLDLLGKGYKVGYEQIREGLYFGDYLLSPRFEYGREHRSIGYRTPPTPHEGLYAWAHVAILMSGKIEFALDAKWAFPRILDPAFGPFGFSAKLDPLPAPFGPRVGPGAEIIATGIWLPTDIPKGCPNYLVAGKPAPPATRVSKRLDYPEFPGGGGTEPEPAHTEYAYSEAPSRWALLWEDTRYDGGQIPDESAYLDVSTAPPPWPPAP
jgi:hypothetical protein